jgi:hypothetical protein
MSSKYLSIEFQGTYQNMLKFFNSKEWDFEAKRINNNKVYVKLSEELSEEVKFFENTPTDDTTGIAITKVSNISETEYTNTAENGFELINAESKPVESTPVPSISDVRKHENVRQVNEVKFPESPVSTSITSEHFNNSVSKALSDTVLPSKSPLDSRDPFAYLTSRRYLRTFAIAATAVLTILAIFD